jgi:hypothetical protein
VAPSRTLDAEIGRLYQLPLDEFTAARNALAKQAGGDAARIRALSKPPVPAWAVNQLFWKDRSTWDDLIAAAENARKVNRAVLAGRAGDVRAANKVHEEALDRAFKSTLSLLASSGHPATDATRQAISITLRALPGADPAGRLTQPLQPGGFEALAGVSIRTKDTKGTKDAKEPKDTKDRVRQRQAEAAAARELNEAEAAARRGEFEQARMEREAKRVEEAVEKAREAVARATEELERTEREAKQAAGASKAAADRARKAQDALARAKAREK